MLYHDLCCIFPKEGHHRIKNPTQPKLICISQVNIDMVLKLLMTPITKESHLQRLQDIES